MNVTGHEQKKWYTEVFPLLYNRSAEVLSHALRRGASFRCVTHLYIYTQRHSASHGAATLTFGSKILVSFLVLLVVVNMLFL
jgi:hypothetical protein